MNIDILKSLESDQGIIQKYIGISSFGKNRIVYLPLITGIGLLLFVVLAILNNLTETIGMPVIIGTSVVIIVCFVLVKIIAASTKKKLLAETKHAPTCVAKKVVGNDTASVYYCIYTTTEKRHDEAFIDRITDKIHNAIQQSQTPIEKDVSNLFRPDFIKPNEFGKRLPAAFTENIEVWRKQVSFVGVQGTIIEKIKDDNDKFAMVAIIPENARLLLDYYKH